MSREWILFPLLFYSFCYSAGAELPEKDAIDDERRLHPILEPLTLKGVQNPDELNAKYWRDNAQDYIRKKVRQPLDNRPAKNIIMFLGDGMSIHTISATRAYIKDENIKLSFEEFPYFGLSKTYCVDSQVADSACTATAYLSGVKSNYGTIGVNAKVPRYHCTKGTDKSTFTESIAKWAQDANKSTGIVTTARVTHASPAGVYAHTADRNWENDQEITKSGCSPELNIDIASQLVHWPVGKKLNVVLGGGRSQFRDKSVKDEDNKRGYRTDGRDLIDEWLKDRQSLGNASYVWNRSGLMKVDIGKTDYLLGLFSPSHCPFHGDIKRNGLEKSQPTLTEMTELAIKMLQKNKEGYFLFVEGARIDMAHHETKARKALEDTEEFANAIRKAKEITGEDTLIVVTSDHSHTMSINGYPVRGNDILGLSGNKGDDNLPYTTLSYANGLGFYNTYAKKGARRDISKDNFKDANYEYLATVPLSSETHGGEDVGVFAVGPKANLFVGNYEQNNIPLMMAYASQIGPYASGNINSDKVTN